MYDLSLINGKVYLEGFFVKKDIYINDDKIVRITTKKLESKKIIDCTDRLIMPGFIDSHVHFDLDLGEFKSRDNFHQGSIIAALGGITTFIDFLDPINKNDEFEESFNNRLNLAKESLIDYSFHTTIGNFEDDVKELIENAKKKGIPSIKVFTTYKESNRKISFKKLYELISDEILVLIHAEKNDLITEVENISDYENSRSCDGEYLQMLEISAISEMKNGKVYFVHTTCGNVIEKINKKFNESLKENIFFESCPQYFYLDKTKYNREDGELFLLAPPLRSKKESKILKENIDIINVISTDHCSFTKNDKRKYKEISKIPKGLGSIEFSFSLMYNLFGEKIIDKFTKNPAKIFGLCPNKGDISLNTDADLVVFNPNKEFVIDSGNSNSDYSPYEGIRLKGRVEKTFLRGKLIVDNYEYIGNSKGKFIRRKYESNKEC
jgi:dihydropyrimidinase